MKKKLSVDQVAPLIRQLPSSILNLLKPSEIHTNITLNFVNDYYSNFEKKYPVKVVNERQFNTPVNFKQAKCSPIHRWYTYKEGFSPAFVEEFINRFKTIDDSVIFDPFGGIGTTVVQSGLMGHTAFSNDVNPLSNFIANAKGDIYTNSDLDALEKEKLKLKSYKFDKKNIAPTNETVSKYFSEETLDTVLKIQYWIDTIKHQKSRHLIFIAFISILESISTHRKDGNGVKRKKNFSDDSTILQISDLLIKRIEIFINDIKENKIKIKPTVSYMSSFDEYLLPRKADIVITSPPYANCFDYSKVYLVELWFGGFFKNAEDQRKFRESSVISHVHYKWSQRHHNYGHELIDNEIYNCLKEQPLWDKKIPSMLVGYFNDMGKVLFELSKNLNNKATVGIVVGNSVYSGIPIATDILLSEIAIKLGYELVGIESYRTLTPSSQQLRIIRDEDKKYLRESLIILRWK